MGRRAWALVLVLAVARPAAAQVVPAAPTTPTTPVGTPSSAPTASMILPVAGGKDYFGPPLSQKFDEKTVFPDPPAALKPKPPELLPPPKPIILSDGFELPPPPPLPPPVKRWFGGFEFGLNGSSGNADILNVRLGSNVDRKTESNRFHTDLLYTLSRQEGKTQQDQAILNARDEILFGPSPWSVFSALQVEYDAFRAYNFRAGTYDGLSYRWVKTDKTFFSTRFGAGAVRELSGNATTKDRWVAEAVLGGDLNHKFTDRQAYVSSVDVYPNLSRLGEYRIRARAAYEIVLDPKRGMVLRMGVQDRFDSSPGNAKRNDVNYFTTLLFKF